MEANSFGQPERGEEKSGNFMRMTPWGTTPVSPATLFDGSAQSATSSYNSSSSTLGTPLPPSDGATPSNRHHVHNGQSLSTFAHHDSVNSAESEWSQQSLMVGASAQKRHAPGSNVHHPRSRLSGFEVEEHSPIADGGGGSSSYNGDAVTLSPSSPFTLPASAPAPANGSVAHRPRELPYRDEVGGGGAASGGGRDDAHARQGTYPYPRLPQPGQGQPALGAQQGAAAGAVGFVGGGPSPTTVVAAAARPNFNFGDVGTTGGVSTSTSGGEQGPIVLHGRSGSNGPPNFNLGGGGGGSVPPQQLLYRSSSKAIPVIGPAPAAPFQGPYPPTRIVQSSSASVRIASPSPSQQLRTAGSYAQTLSGISSQAVRDDARSPLLDTLSTSSSLSRGGSTSQLQLASGAGSTRHQLGPGVSTPSSTYHEPSIAEQVAYHEQQLAALHLKLSSPSAMQQQQVQQQQQHRQQQQMGAQGSTNFEPSGGSGQLQLGIGGASPTVTPPSTLTSASTAASYFVSGQRGAFHFNIDSTAGYDEPTAAAGAAAAGASEESSESAVSLRSTSASSVLLGIGGHAVGSAGASAMMQQIQGQQLPPHSRDRTPPSSGGRGAAANGASPGRSSGSGGGGGGWGVDQLQLGIGGEGEQAQQHQLGVDRRVRSSTATSMASQSQSTLHSHRQQLQYTQVEVVGALSLRSPSAVSEGPLSSSGGAGAWGGGVGVSGTIDTFYLTSTSGGGAGEGGEFGGQRRAAAPPLSSAVSSFGEFFNESVGGGVRHSPSAAAAAQSADAARFQQQQLQGGAAPSNFNLSSGGAPLYSMSNTPIPPSQYNTPIPPSQYQHQPEQPSLRPLPYMQQQLQQQQQVEMLGGRLYPLQHPQQQQQQAMMMMAAAPGSLGAAAAPGDSTWGGQTSTSVYPGGPPHTHLTLTSGGGIVKPVMHPDDVGRDMRMMRCRRCNDSGHLMRYCPTVMCYNCRKYGHMTSVCPEPPTAPTLLHLQQQQQAAALGGRFTRSNHMYGGPGGGGGRVPGVPAGILDVNFLQQHPQPQYLHPALRPQQVSQQVEVGQPQHLAAARGLGGASYGQQMGAAGAALLALHRGGPFGHMSGGGGVNFNYGEDGDPQLQQQQQHFGYAASLPEMELQEHRDQLRQQQQQLTQQQQQGLRPPQLLVPEQLRAEQLHQQQLAQQQHLLAMQQQQQMSEGGINPSLPPFSPTYPR